MATKTVIKTNMPQIHGITIINDHSKLQLQQQKQHINDEPVVNVEPKIRIYQKNIDIPAITTKTKTTTTSITRKTTIKNISNDAKEEDVLKKMSQISQTSNVVANNKNNNNNNNNNNSNQNNNNVYKIINNNDEDSSGYAVGCQELETGCNVNNLTINANVSAATKTIEYPYLMLKVGDDDIQTSATESTISTTTNASLLSTIGCESSERPTIAVSVNAMVATPLILGDCYNEAKENNDDNDVKNIHHNNYVESNGICIYNINNEKNNNNNNNHNIYIDEKSKSNFICNGQTLSIFESVRDLNVQHSWNPSQREQQQKLDSGHVSSTHDNNNKNNNNEYKNDDNDDDDSDDDEKASKGDCISVALTDSKEFKDKIHVVKIQIPSTQESTKQTGQLEIVQHSNCVDQLKSTDNNNNNITKQCVTVVQLNEDNHNNNNNNNFMCNKTNKNNLSANYLDILHANNNNLPLGIDSMVQKTQINGSNAVSVNGGGIVNNTGGTTVTELNVTNPNYLYYMMSSGQFSPCDTLDSGTCSDLESNGNMVCHGGVNSPKEPLNHGSSVPKLELHLKTTKIRVNNTNAMSLEHQRASSLTDSEESEASSLSCDSLHSSEYQHQHQSKAHQMASIKSCNKKLTQQRFGTLLPDSLLRDIRGRKTVISDDEAYENLRDSPETVSEQDYIEVETAKFIHERNNANNFNTNSNTNNQKTITMSNKRASKPSKTFIINQENGVFEDTKMNSMPRRYEADKYYDFHVKEHENFQTFNISNNEDINPLDENSIENYFDKKSLSDESFAGYTDIRSRSAVSTIRSSKGTVRGVKNRVRNGIATFLQLQQPLVKSFKEKDVGKVVLYTTSMGIIRDTYAKCSNVKQILRTLLVKFEERDVFMSIEYQQEIKERMQSDIIKVPQLFVEGQHIGDAETVERLNESGELRQLLKPYKSIATTYTCQTCGGYRLLPCPSCSGSKKSVHRNHFTAEFVALKCMNCDEVGLVKCHNC